MIDHDRLFKELLTTFFTEFVALFLPDMSRYLDTSHIEFLDKEVFTDVTTGDKHEVDLVAKVRFQGADAFFLIHVENQATRQTQFPGRMFQYFARLHEKYALPIYPVVLFSYDYPRRREPSQYRVAFPGFTVNQFRYRVIQLNRLNWRDYMRQPNPVASALMAKMQIAPKERPKVKLECLRLLATLRLSPAKMHLISGFVDTYLKLTAAEQLAFQIELTQVAPQEQEEVMQIVTSWMEEGIEKGERNEASKFVQRLLRRKFGVLEPTVVERVTTLPTRKMEELGEALFSLNSIAEVEAWLEAQ